MMQLIFLQRIIAKGFYLCDLKCFNYEENKIQKEKLINHYFRSYIYLLQL